MNTTDLTTQRLDHLGIVAGICRQIDLARRIDITIGQQQRKVNVGQAVQAMVVNALGFVSHPLYLTLEFFTNKSVGLLVGEGIEPEDLNDDCMGRALDAVFEYGITELFASISSHALRVFGIEVSYAHLDSTSISLQGEYAVEALDEGDEPKPIRITYGYSKDHRPDLKQAVLGIISANSSSLPVWLSALDGNRSDSKSFPDLVGAYLEQFTEDEQMPYLVADSAIYNKGNLGTLSEKVKWVSRVPGTVGTVRHLYEHIDRGEMHVVDEDTSYVEVCSDYGGVKQRWVVVFHQPTGDLESHSMQRRLDKEKHVLSEAEGKAADKALKRLMRRDYECEEAVNKAVRHLEKSWGYHKASIRVYPVYRYDRPGRPPANATPRQLWRFEGEVMEDQARIARTRASHGKYVIATNRLDDARLPALRMLSLYKEQTVSVERGFRFLKDPMFFAHSLFLKKPSRIMALLMIMGLSLLVYSLAELQVRQNLDERDETIPDQRGKPTKRPTMRRIFQMFEGVDVLNLEQGGVRQHLILNLTELHEQILRLFSPHVRKICNLTI